MKLLISACLLGVKCRYDGCAKPNPAVLALAKEHTLIPVCPEQLGGLATPRPPAERTGSRVVTEAGTDVTRQYQRGAEQTLLLAQLTGCRYAILKAKSPSCGKGTIYDGSFTRTLCAGNGVASELLSAQQITVLTEEELDLLPRE